jgi:Protein of unknown function (DUF3435)
MLIMKHLDRRTFLNHYHPRDIDIDMERTICGLDPDVELMRTVSRHIRWIDKRRPRRLAVEEKKRIEGHPELKEALEKLREASAEHARTQSPDLLALKRHREQEVRNTQKRLWRALRNQIRERFDENQAFLDIEAQLSGDGMVDESEDDSISEVPMHPLQLQLMQKLAAYPTSDCLEDEWKRHNEAVEAVTQYCDVFEGGPLWGRPKQTPSLSVTASGATRQGGFEEDSDLKKEDPDLSVRDRLLRATKEHIDTAQPVKACFQCFGDKRLPNETRCHMYYDHGCLTRHFRARHLTQEPFKCNYCKLSLCYKTGGVSTR